VGHKLTALLTAEDSDQVTETLEKFRRGENIEPIETVRIAKDGRRILVSLTVSPIRDEAGVIIGSSTIARDISERKLSEEELRRTNQRLEGALVELQKKTEELAAMTQQLWQASKLATLGELAASVAHELNNPLATISLRLESLAEQLAVDEDKLRSVQIVADEVDRMGKLVGSLLEFSRRGHQQISTIVIGEEIEKSIELIEYYLRTRKIEVSKDFETRLPTVQADRQQLRQLFLNLLTNASDAMPDGGKLVVRARNTRLENGPRAVRLEFADAGTGIAAAELEKIWEPFFTTKPEGKGTGLGLAICRRVVEEHQGTISIESRLGQGTTVIILLPATHGEETRN
jgi:signal transduction histidine kinase